jgi:hypothetical protein
MSSSVFAEVPASRARLWGAVAAWTGLGGREVLPYALARSSLDLVVLEVVDVDPGLYDKPDNRFMNAVGAPLLPTRDGARGDSLIWFGEESRPRPPFVKLVGLMFDRPCVPPSSSLL